MGNMIKHQLKILFKNPILIMNFWGYPVILTLIIGYLTKSFYGDGITSYEYYSNSMLIFLFMGAGLITIYNFIDSNLVDGNFRAVYAPISRSTIYISQIISSTIFAVIGIIINVLIFKFLVGITYNGSEFFVILSLGTLAFLSTTIATLLCAFINNIGAINGVFNLVQAGFCLLGGAFFSMEALGGIPAAISNISPVKYIIDGILLSIYDNNHSMILIISLVNIVLAIVVIFVTKKKFKVESYI
ncbi:MAG: ABC transporter permease [Sarcina sp.]